jgi:hypothetical protein
MKNKQTAVEWLVQEIENQCPQIDISWKESLINQAKEMEKEQIMDAHWAGAMNWQGGKENFNGFQQDNHYFNEMYQ